MSDEPDYDSGLDFLGETEIPDYNDGLDFLGEVEFDGYFDKPEPKPFKVPQPEDPYALKDRIVAPKPRPPPIIPKSRPAPVVVKPEPTPVIVEPEPAPVVVEPEPTPAPVRKPAVVKKREVYYEDEDPYASWNPDSAEN